MGLNICKKIVEHNGGTISVSSDGENLGSTFSFTMPMSITPDDRDIHSLTIVQEMSRSQDNDGVSSRPS